jgi:hypothetical protein
MALSLVVLLVPILLVVGAYRWLQEGDKPMVMDPTATVEEAQRAGFEVAAPQGLGEGWRSISARFVKDADGMTLRIGYVTPGENGVQLLQSDTTPEKLIERELGESPRPEGTESVGARGWQRYVARKGEYALVLAEPRRTVIVIGAAPIDEVRALAAAVR